MSGCVGLRRWAACTSLAGVLLIGGCHHRRAKALVLPPPAPVPLDNEATPTTVLTAPPKPKLPDVPVAEAATQPKKVKKRVAKAVVVPPAATPGSLGAAGGAAPGTALPGPTSEAAAATGAASVTPTGTVSAIGALTAGGEQNPKTMQEAAELISSNERRLEALTSDVTRAQAALVSKVRTFQRDAQQAFGSGDAEGARTLAMKGKLLLDDLLKSGT